MGGLHVKMSGYKCLCFCSYLPIRPSIDRAQCATGSMASQQKQRCVIFFPSTVYATRLRDYYTAHTLTFVAFGWPAPGETQFASRRVVVLAFQVVGD